MDNVQRQTKYFKNAELTRLYGVSDKAVRNWIERAIAGKIQLELTQDKGRTYVADSIPNSLLLHTLVEGGRKYRNHRAHRIVKPTGAFYDLHSTKQIVDIINSLEKYNETPVQYRYLGKGANYWDAYLKKIADVPGSYLRTTIDLLKLDLAHIDTLLANYEKVNVIDIGVGNGLAVKDLLIHLQGTGKLNKYIGVDISERLLNKTEQNIRKWLGASLTIKKYVKDITHERCIETLIDGLQDSQPEVLNIYLLLGGTITNLREPDQALKTIRDSMAKGALLITTLRLDSKKSRSFFDYDVPNDRSLLAFHDRYTLDMLSIDRSYYNIEQDFDEDISSRYIRVRLRYDISIEFNLKGTKKTVRLNKGDSILLIRMWHYQERQVINIFQESGFTPLRSIKSQDEEFLLLAARV